MPKLYELYWDFMNTKYPSLDKVKLSYYRHVFNTEFNLRFASLETNTCSIYDLLRGKIDMCKNQASKEDSVEKLKSDLEKQKALAKQGLDILTKLTTSKYNSPNVLALCFDLQQTLPTPKLSASVAY